MPLRAFIDFMEGQNRVNPFYQESYLDTEKKDDNYDVLDGWICHKEYDQNKGGSYITRICRIPDGYSVIHIWRMTKTNDLPFGKWIGPAETMKTLLTLHYLHRDVESKMQELVGRVDNTDYEEEREAEFFPSGKYLSQCNG